MIRDDFLRDPLHVLFRAPSGAGERIAPDWMHQAWEENAALREAACYYLLRSISKVGSLVLAADWVASLGPALSALQVAALYEHLRASTDRRELEWRPAFEQAFPSCAEMLPAIDLPRARHHAALDLFSAIRRNNLEAVTKALVFVRASGTSLEDVHLTATEIMEATYFAVFAQTPDDRVWTPLEIASAEGLAEVARLLRDAGATEQQETDT